MSDEFERFKKACLVYIDQFGLSDWRVTVHCEPLRLKLKTTRAQAQMNWTQRAARIVWNSTHVRPREYVCDETVESVAMHEVLHVVLNPFVNIAAKSGDANDVAVDAEEHAVIRRVIRAFERAGNPPKGEQ